jgi:hypothetical protein
MSMYWRKFVPEAKKVLDSEVLDALADTLDSKPEQTRWINDLLPQIERLSAKRMSFLSVESSTRVQSRFSRKPIASLCRGGRW